LGPQSFLKLHSKHGNQSNYCCGGLIFIERGIAGENAFNHAGSNTMNYCNIWIVLTKNIAFISVTNIGGNDAFKATDELTIEAIKQFAN